ncbi:MAG: hypothetical protein AAGF12_43025, partial [Myxococcota bacterium]
AAAGIFVLTQNFGWQKGDDTHQWTNPQRNELSGPGGGPIGVAVAAPMPPDVQNALDAHRDEVKGGQTS